MLKIVFIFFISVCSFAEDNSINKILFVKQKSMLEGKISNIHVFIIKLDLQNLSGNKPVREIILNAVLYNKENEVIGSKLITANWDSKRKPFVKRSFIGKIKNTFEKLKTEETPRAKMENANVLKPGETREFEIPFYDEDLKSSDVKDRVPAGYSVKLHGAKLVQVK